MGKLARRMKKGKIPSKGSKRRKMLDERIKEFEKKKKEHQERMQKWKKELEREDMTPEEKKKFERESEETRKLIALHESKARKDEKRFQIGKKDFKIHSKKSKKLR